MSEENQVPSVETTAKEMGWKPLEEYEGDKTKWVNAEIFVARAPLFEKIEADKRSHRREMDEMRKMLTELSNHNKTVAEASYKKALEDLKSQKKAALDEGDTTKALVIADQIEELKESKPQVPQPAPNNQPAPEFVEWLAENNWYEKDVELREEADTIGAALALKGTPIATVLKQVEQKIKKMYPEKFESKRVVAPSGAESPSGKSSTGKREPTLSAEEEKVMNKLISLGAITKEKYLEDLKLIKGQ